jgi:hypothetical protein
VKVVQCQPLPKQMTGFYMHLNSGVRAKGRKALIAEIIGGELARVLGFKVPEIVFATLDEAFGRTEPDEEIQDLLKASVGLNLALHYLTGSITFDPLVTTIDAKLASQIVWLDSYIINMDRTARNTNMLVWRKELWLIDHGAALYFHHAWQNWKEQAVRPFDLVKNHVLLSQASQVRTVDAEFRAILTHEKIRAIVSLIPDEWLADESSFDSIEEHRQAYIDYLEIRLANADIFVNAIEDARK